MQEVRDICHLKQEIKGIIKPQRQTDANGTAEDAMCARVCNTPFSIILQLSLNNTEKLGPRPPAVSAPL